MEIGSNLKRFILKICFFSLVCCVLLWFSLSLYGLLYYVYIPAVAHVKQIYFRYDVPCSGKEMCRFPYYNATLVEKGSYELLTRGQAYAIELLLDMPESERNTNQGMFMVRLDMLSETGDVLQSSYRPALLHYRSNLFKVLHTLFLLPALLAGSLEEKQSMVIPLFEQYMETPYYPAHFAFIEIQAYKPEIYSARLRIHAQFTGLRYFMYYWPVVSTMAGIGSNFMFLSTIVAFIWIRQIMNHVSLENKMTAPSSPSPFLRNPPVQTLPERKPKETSPESSSSGIEDLRLPTVEEEEALDEELSSSLRRRTFTPLLEEFT